MKRRTLAHRTWGGERLVVVELDGHLALGCGRAGGHVRTFAIADAAELRGIAELLIEAAAALEPRRLTRCRPRRRATR